MTKIVCTVAPFDGIINVYILSSFVFLLMEDENGQTLAKRLYSR